MDQLLRDLRHSFRALLRTPVLFAAAVLTLAVGTGLATGIAAVAYGVLLRPLPYPQSDRLVAITIHSAFEPEREVGLKLTEIEDWASRMRAFERIAGHSRTEFTLRGAGEPRSIRTAMVTDGFFETLGTSAEVGSTAGMTRGAPVAAVSRRLVDRIGGDDEWWNRGVTIGSGGFQVAAVIPAVFAMPSDEIEVWVRADAVPGIRLYSSDDQRRFQLIGRLAPGVTLPQAVEDVRRVAREIDGAQEERRRRDATARPLHERERREARTTVIPFVVGSALVLLIACANVSGLLVGRAVAREGEFAVRRALGASAGRILRASLAESFAVAVCGWLLGVWLGYLVMRLFASRAAETLPNLPAVRFDAPVVLISLGLTILVALMSGAAPALRAARADPNTALKHAAGRAGRRHTAGRTALVVGQIALSVVLLVSAGLLLRTVEQLMSADRGFEAANGVAMRLRLTPDVRFQVEDRAPFVDRLVSDVRALPGVVAAGVGSDLPPNGTQIEMTVRIIRDDRDETFALSPSAVTPGYLEALGVSIISGRLFEERDRGAATPPIVISEAAARVMFGDRDPAGTEWPAPLPGRASKGVRPLIIGVVADIRHKGLDRAAPAVLFAPWESLAPSNAHLVVRTTGSPEAIAPALRRIVHTLDPSLPLFTPETLEEVVAGSIAPRRLRLQLAGAFAGLALALAVVALWGAMAQNVLNRRRELAVRLALGATNEAAVRLVVRGGLVVIASGIAMGLAAGAAAGRMLQHLLHGIAPSDPLTFAASGAVAALVSLAACYLPARRAAAISPAELLRES